MVDGNAYGWNWDGLYDPELIAYYGRQRLEVPDAWSETVKLVVLGGRYSVEKYQARHYAMARNLVFEVRRHYDEALSRFDVLVMPTLPMVATPIPAASDPREVQIARALADGLPVGMMIVGKRFDDAACLRVAHAFERLSGGFPAPPGAA
jgi:amidase